MKGLTRAALGRATVWLLVLCLLLGLMPAPARAEEPSLTPEDLSYEHGNIILHKQAERIAPDEWRVTVRATVGEVPVEKRKFEVVFLMDCSTSMINNSAHKHSDECRPLECTIPEHVHDDDCYGDGYSCGINSNHVHDTDYANSDCYTRCTYSSNRSHWQNRNKHRDGLDCVSVNYYGSTRYYYLDCDEHAHDDSCRTLTCTETEHTHNSECYADDYTCGYGSGSRRDVAVAAAEKLIANLPEGTDITRLVFSGSGYFGEVSNYYDSSNHSGTYMWDGINRTLNGDYFSDADTKKIFVLLTDGEASSTDTRNNKTSATTALNAFKNPDKTNGSVFSIGFSYNDSALEAIAGNGGYYMYAEDAKALTAAFDKLEQTLTAMLEDPMGTTVGFDKTSIDTIQSSGGVVTPTEDTIYWYPAEDGSDTVRNSTIEYSYTVKLNEQASLDAGEHNAIALNNPTYFYYGIKDGEGNTDMQSAAFPIPHASYAVSKLQTKWQLLSGRDIQTPLAEETVICDYQSPDYIPDFEQDYETITPIIPVPNSNDYYRYVKTIVRIQDGNTTETVEGVEIVDATRPVRYEVIHQYELIESDVLSLSGTKVLIGRDFLPGDVFNFTITADNPGSPLPANTTVSVRPESGTSVTFAFDNITYQNAGVYSYTIKEQPGNLDGVIYDTRERKLVVTVTEVNGEMVVSYTLDGEENGHLNFTNRLETGALRVKKNLVTSHLPEHQDMAFNFLVNLKDMSGRPLTGAYQLQLADGTVQEITFTNGYASISLKAGQSAEVLGLPDGAVYTVTEGAAGGFTATATGDSGTIAAHQTQEASFDNEYHSEGRYPIIAWKVLDGKTLEQDEFSFSLLDENGNVVGTGKNNADGSVFMTTLFFTEEDIGTRTYTIVEDVGTRPGIVYDRTPRKVTITIADKGDGTLSVTDDLNGQRITFTNRFITNQLSVSKLVEGNMADVNRTFSFTVSMPEMIGQNVYMSTDGGATFQALSLNAQGQADFTLKHGQQVIFYPVSGAYTVTENDPGSYTTTWTVDQGEPVTGCTASGVVSTGGSHAAFVNTLQMATPTGIHTSSASAVAGIFLAISLLTVASAKRRWSGLEQ